MNELIESPRAHKEVAAFGKARLLRDAKGRLEIIGGSNEEKQVAREWAERNLNDGYGIRWYSKSFTRRVKLPQLYGFQK